MLALDIMLGGRASVGVGAHVGVVGWVGRRGEVDVGGGTGAERRGWDRKGGDW